MTLALTIASIPSILMALQVTFLVVMIGIVIYKFLLNKLIDFISIILVVVSLVFWFISFNKTINIIMIVITIIDYIWLITCNIQYYLYLSFEKIRKYCLVEQVKNDTCDFYLCLNHKDEIIDYSGNFTKLTKLNNESIIHKDGWTLLFKYLNILKLNNNEFIVSNQVYFKDHIYDNLSKFKLTEFNLDVLNEDNKVVHYLGYIQGHYFKQHLIGKAIYLYQDKNAVMNSLNGEIYRINNELNLHHQVLNSLMGMSNECCLYFDYQERLYYATKSFMDFVGMDKSSYTFLELYNMILPDEQENYVSQSEMVNCHSVTKIKYHISIKNVNYDVLEESIYLGDNNELVSIIHLLGKSEQTAREEILSTAETIDLMEKLATNPLNGLQDKTLDIIDKALRIKSDEE